MTDRNVVKAGPWLPYTAEMEADRLGSPDWGAMIAAGLRWGWLRDLRATATYRRRWWQL